MHFLYMGLRSLLSQHPKCMWQSGSTSTLDSGAWSQCYYQQPGNSNICTAARHSFDHPHEHMCGAVAIGNVTSPFLVWSECGKRASIVASLKSYCAQPSSAAMQCPPHLLIAADSWCTHCTRWRPPATSQLRILTLTVSCSASLAFQHQENFWTIDESHTQNHFTNNRCCAAILVAIARHAECTWSCLHLLLMCRQLHSWRCHAWLSVVTKDMLLIICTEYVHD